MTDDEIAQNAVEHAVANSRDSRTHRWLQLTRVGMVVFMLVLGVLVVLLFIRQEARDKNALALVQQVQAQCDSGEFKGSVCDKADDVEKDVKADPVLIQGEPGEDSTVPGPKGDTGEPGADSTVPGPQGVKGDSGTAVPGTYSCGDGQYMWGFTIDEDGAITLDCMDMRLRLVGHLIGS